MKPRRKWPLPQPQPTTPFKGPVIGFGFDDYHKPRNRRNGRYVQREVRKLFKTFGAYRCKPKRGSRGVIWNNRAFYWSAKGYYRPGKANGHRAPLQHLIYEKYFGKPVPKGHEIFFKDRDKHNFLKSNLELLSKADMHQRIFEIGETRSLTFEERSQIRGRWAVKRSREMTSVLFSGFKTKGKNENHDKIKF